MCVRVFVCVLYVVSERENKKSLNRLQTTLATTATTNAKETTEKFLIKKQETTTKTETKGRNYEN